MPRSPLNSRRFSAIPLHSASRTMTQAPVRTPAGHCCDQCPLGRFAGQAVAFVPPDAPALPGRREKRRAHDPRAARRRCSPRYPVQPNPARAPPLAVSRYSPRAPCERSHSFRLEVNIPCQHPYPFGHSRLHGRAAARGSHPRSLTPCAAIASFRPPSPSTIPASPTSSRCDPQLCSLQLRRRPRVGRELQLDERSPGPQPGDGFWTDTGASGRLRLERALHRVAVASAVHPRRRVHVQARLRHILGRNRHGNPCRSGGQNTYSPLVDFGLGFGTLPSALKYLRPFAITGESARPRRGRTIQTATQMCHVQLGVHPPIQPAVLQLAHRRDRQRLPQTPGPGR